MTDPTDPQDQGRSGGGGEHPPARCRRFNLGDAMALVAATALFLTVARTYLVSLWGPLGEVSFGQWIGESPWYASMSRKDAAIRLLAVCLGTLSTFTLCGIPAFMIVRLRRPRPSVRELVFQPGVMACEAIAVVFVCDAFAVIFSNRAVLGWTAFNTAILPSAWTILAMTGRWRPEPGWIDRFGRILGVCWIAAGLFSILLLGVLGVL